MLLLVVGAAAAGCGAHWLLRRIVPVRDLIEHNDVAGFMISVVGVIYAVLLAFVVVVVWQQYTSADADYGSEVSAAADVHDFSRSLANADSRAAQQLVHRYIHAMIDQEWPAMGDGGQSAAATATLAELSRVVTRVAPQTRVQEDARTHLMDSVERLFDLRNRRLANNSSTLPAVLWVALIAGACITVGFGFLFGVVNFRVQLIMTAAVAALIGIMFSLLIELDFPFRRDSAIGPERWIELERYLDIAGDAASLPAREPRSTVAYRVAFEND